MGVAIITGSAGLIGSEATRHFARKGMDVVGIDNDMRSVFFGAEASTAWMSRSLKQTLRNYTHYSADVRNQNEIFRIFRHYGSQIELVIHTAAQPSHDWAAREPLTDFHVNAMGTLTALEATRQFCPEAVFLFTSTNKVYGDAPNELPLIELATRWEIDPAHAFSGGIDESMPIDHSMHGVFGVSKTSADLMVQEYGRYFGLKTVSFRSGCVTGPGHSGTQLHGFLAYLMRCCVTGTPYKVLGYKGKQVRDNIHSHDLVSAFDAVFEEPGAGEVYNLGGGRHSNCSMLEAIAMCEEIAGMPLEWSYVDENRTGDHIWWISDQGKFRSHYPRWRQSYDTGEILRESYEANVERWLGTQAIQEIAV
jgi:CDP-paratose 2-epimerase